MAGWGGELEEVRVRLEEVATAVRWRLEGIEADPDCLNAVEERLATLERLFRKFGIPSAAGLLTRRDEVAAEIAELESDTADRAELERQAAEALEVYCAAALELSAGRSAWGRELSAGIAAELADLGLGKARLEVELGRRRRDGSALVIDGEPLDFGRAGVDQVAFQFAPNPGEAPRPLSLIASGGELSRIYLALQLAAHPESAEGGAALIFDEVDSGIGGAQAAALGRKLQRLGKTAQVLVVTHLPQVASFANHHFKVTKSVRGGRTLTAVEPLDPPGRAEEVARMLGGERVTDLTLSHARELIAAAAASRAGGPAPARRRSQGRR